MFKASIIKIINNNIILNVIILSASVFLLFSCTTKEEIEKLYYINKIPRTTYQKFLFKAEKGDVEVQNLLGYMLYYGEGAKQDYDKAHQWFHRSAEQGNTKAQRNLGLFHARISSEIPEKYYDPIESNEWLLMTGNMNISQELSDNYNINQDYFQSGSTLDIGKKVYQIFCAGCHGFEGIAAYKAAPSFATGERLEKPESELLNSIRNGKGMMPSWVDILPLKLRKASLIYIRSELYHRIELEKLTTVDDKLIVNNDSTELNTYKLGAQTYSMFCAGCHGFNGIAYYINSPSFALGERMDKTDKVLATSISNGLSVMPSWGSKLSEQEILAVLVYIRRIEAHFNVGIERSLNQPLGNFFDFHPDHFK